MVPFTASRLIRPDADGEAVDYAVYVQVQRQRDDNTYLWRGLWLAMLTSSAGFVAMMLSGFAGLMQLGLMSIIGIAVAALVARFCLPDVLRPLDAARLARFALLARISKQAPRLRVAIMLIGAASLLLLMTRGDGHVERSTGGDIAAGSGLGELDARLRSDIRLGDLRFVWRSMARRRTKRSRARGPARSIDRPEVTRRDRGVRLSRCADPERGDTEGDAPHCPTPARCASV